MTPDNARTAAAKFADTWPGKIRVEIWTEVLEPLDVAQVRETYRRLRDTAEHAPTPAAFRTLHRSMHGGHDTTPAHREPCAICDGSGWETVTVQRPDYPHPTSGVLPCRCTNGRQYIEPHRRAIEANEKALTPYRTAPGATNGRQTHHDTLETPQGHTGAAA